jgi:hypothetical protein
MDNEYFNIFQIWKENGEKLPFKVIRNSWNESAGHFLIVEKVIVKKWPYGDAYGQYFYHRKPGEKGKIDSAGTYAWRLKKSE